VKIIEALPVDLPDFFSYIARQLADNGSGDVPIFQPVSKTEQSLSTEDEEKFFQGILLSFQDLAWRKLWLVKDEQDDVRGHIDLRHNGDAYCAHRVRLGMGVENGYRENGIGTQLLETVIDFCVHQPEVEWLDLCVLSDNVPAKNLYLKYGFHVIGETLDQYRIDNKPVGEIAMTKKIMR
jgi:RimJ/RimL family protein N-acetyltransferase